MKTMSWCRVVMGVTWVALGLLSANGFAMAKDTNLPVMGWIEPLKIGDAGLAIEAKIDTGADFSSINAEIIKRFTSNGEDWVKFIITNKQDEHITLELPVVRYANIKRKQAEPVKRPVVHLSICYGNERRTVEVNLAQRGNFKYKMLIGRNYLKNHYLVDSGLKHTAQPNC